MKKNFIIALLALQVFSQATAQLYHGSFKRNKIAMSSNAYKPDSWEKPYYDSSIKSAFPSDLAKSPKKYKDKFIHLIGVVESLYTEHSGNISTVTFVLDNKYWDYIEDYSIQDEVMFVSEKGDGKFLVKLLNITQGLADSIQNFPAEKKLFLVYGIFTGFENGYPLITAQQIKYIDYELYTTHVFSYEVQRDKNGNVVVDKKGKAQLTNFDILKVAKAGQNK